MIEKDASSVHVRVWLFGECCVEYRNHNGTWKNVLPQEWGGTAHSRRLLGFLLLHGRKVGRGKLIEQLWPGSDSSSLEGALNKAVSNVRKVFRTDDLLTLNSKRTIYQLADQSHVWADVDTYVSALQEAELSNTSISDRKHLLETAQAYFERGTLLEGEDDLWCYAKREFYGTAYYRCLLWLADTYEIQGEMRQAERLMEQLLQKNPLDEVALCHLMRFLQQQGLAAEAFRRYQGAVFLFKQQGMALSPETETLARNIQLYPQSPMDTTSFTIAYPLNLGFHKNTSDFSVPSDLRLQESEGIQDFFAFSYKDEHIKAHINASPAPREYVQQKDVLETPSLDCALKFGIMLAQTTTLIQQWYGMAMFSHELQNQVDQQIKAIELLKTQYTPEAYTLSRRSFLITLAASPAVLLASRRQTHKVALELEEFLPQCAASIIACWHLSKASFLETIPPIIDAYLPTLITIVKSAPSYRETAAELVAQCYFLKAILAWHLENLDHAERYCIQAMQYSNVANNTNLRLTALNQHALIFYYKKDFLKALAKSEEAKEVLLHTSNEHIYPIMQGRVYMYLSAFQAQQLKTGAERTLEQAQEGFARQAATVEAVPLYADCGDASLKLWDGLTHYHLGAQNKAHTTDALISLRIFGTLQASEKIPERFRLECLTNRILATIQANDIEETIACFNAGKQGARALESWQRKAEVDYSYQQMLRQWPEENRIQNLNTIIQN